jgi:hypothetical protein
LGDDFAGSWVDRVEFFAANSINKLIVDKQLFIKTLSYKNNLLGDHFKDSYLSVLDFRDRAHF